MHVSEHFLDLFLYRLDLTQSQVYFDILKLSYDRLEFRIVDSVKRLDDPQLLVKHLVFRNIGLGRRVVLLIAEKDMVE